MKQKGISPIPNQQGLFKSFRSVRLLPLLISLITVGVCFLGLGTFNQTLAATYYVDNSITDTFPANATPDCTNYNTSTFACSGGAESAYATIADVNAKSFSSDDQVLFRKGQTWREELHIPSSGTSGHPITFGAFGSGDDPIITANNDVLGVSGDWSDQGGNVWRKNIGSTTVPIVVFNSTQVGVNDATPDSQYEWTYSDPNLDVYATSNPASYYTAMEVPTRNFGGYMYNKDYITMTHLTFKFGKFSAWAVQGDSDNNTLSNCSFIGSVSINGALQVQGTADNIIIEYSTIDGDNPETSNDAFHLFCDGSDCPSGTIIRNNIIKNGAHTTLKLQNVTNNIVEHNEIYVDNSSYGRGVEIYGGDGIGGNIFRYNYVHSSKDGLYTDGSNAFNGDSNQIYYNLFIGDEANCIDVVTFNEGGVDYVAQDNIFNNNVCYGFTGEGFHMNDMIADGHFYGNIVKNNIFMNNDSADNHYQVLYTNVIPSALTAFTFTNNVIYDSNTSNTVYYDGSVRTVDWMNTNVSGYWSDNIAVDPLFVGGGEAKPYPYFYPRSYSPVINAGTDVGLTSDYLGVFVPQAAAPDIGAFEYTVSVPENIWFFFPLFMALPRLIFLLSNKQGRRLLFNLISGLEFKSLLKEIYLPYLNLFSYLLKRVVKKENANSFSDIGFHPGKIVHKI